MSVEQLLLVDVGATAVKWAIATDGVLGEVTRARTLRGTPAAFSRQLIELHERAAGDQPLPWGLCLPGLIDQARGRIVRSGNLGLRDEPIADRLETAGARPRLIVNDVTAAAVGEAAGGTVALLQLGTGVAGRIVIEGAVVSGAHGYGGEVGHLVYVRGGRRCACGARGCVEAYAGMAAIRERYTAMGRAVPTASDVLADARSDPEAARVLEDALHAIAFAAAVLVSASDPGTVRLGGGMAAAWGARLVEATRAGLATRLPPELTAGTTVELSALGDQAPLLGLQRLIAAQVR
jgi:glucokinase